MKTSSEVLDAINDLERQFPVTAWRSGDIDLWPTYRFRLYGNAISAFLQEEEPAQRAGRLRQLASRASRALWRVPLAAWRDRDNNAVLTPGASAVFLSDGMSFVQLAGVWFDRVIDPVVQALQARGLESLKLTPLAEAHVPRHTPSIFIQPAIDRIKLLGGRRHSAVIAPEFARFEAAARRTFGPRAPSLAWLHVQAARLNSLAAWFGRLLERSKASHAFVNTYYSLEGLAFVQAARRLGMRSIDLQHGMQGQHHVAYARWAALAPAGYSTLPDEFWVWGAQEASAINAWSTACGKHQPRVTGNFWLQRWSDDSDPLISDYLAKARALRGTQPAVKQALVCMTWGVGAQEADNLIEAARLCGPSVAWWWRLHPVEAGLHAQFGARLARHGLDGTRVEQITYLPLYAVLRTADLVLSHSSSVIQEAADLGIPSVVTSEYGAGLHAELVARGVALRALDAPAIAAAVMTLASRPTLNSPIASNGRMSLQSAVDATFTGARSQPEVRAELSA